MVFLANYLGKYTTKDTTSKSRNAKDHKTTNIIKVHGPTKNHSKTHLKKLV